MRATSWIAAALISWGALVGLAPAEDQMQWQPNLESAQRLAAQTNRLVLIHFWAPWCKPCMRLEREVFTQPEVGRALQGNFVLVKLNADDSPSTTRMYGVSSLPTDVIVTPAGRLVAQFQSPPTANQYVTQLNQWAEGNKQLARSGPGNNPVAPAQAQVSQPHQPPVQAAHQAGAPQPQVIPASQQTPTQSSAWANASDQKAAVPAYSDERYAEYLRHQPPAQPTAAAASTAGFGANGYPNQPANTGSAWGRPTAQVAGPPPIVQTPEQIAQQQAATALLQTKLPPGSPPLCLDGGCPVTLTEQRRSAPGKLQHGAVHMNRTYLFAGPEEQKKFLANPDRYCPAISGNDPVLALDERRVVPGSRIHGVYYENRIYLFSSESTLQRFQQNPNRYVAEVVQAMR